MLADVAGSDFFKGVEFILWAFYVTAGAVTLALLWAIVRITRLLFSRDRVMRVEPSVEDLRSAVRMACQSPNAGQILVGRQQVLSWTRASVVAHMEQVAIETLDLSDHWQYRRLLELTALLDAGLVQRIVMLGLNSADATVREAARDYRK